MKAVRATKPTPTSPPNLSIETIPKPEPGPDELLVKIAASSIQPSDILNSHGSFSTTTYPRTLGRDFSGTVVSGDLEGKEVYGTSGNTFSFTADGAQAEYAIVPTSGVALKPSSLSFAQAADIGTPFTTAYATLIRGRATKEDVVLVLGATGSVGSAVAQIAREVVGSRVLGVGRREGMEINSVSDRTLKGALELTGGRGVDVVVDTVGDFALTLAAFHVLAPKGRLVTITAPRKGSTQLSIDILDFYRRQVEIIGVNGAANEQSEMAELLAQLGSAFDSGKLTPPKEEGLTLIGIERALEAYEGKFKHAVIVFE